MEHCHSCELTEHILRAWQKDRQTATPTHRLALDGLSEELAGGDEDGADDEHGDGPFVVQLEGQVVDRDLAHTKEDLSRGLYTSRGEGGLKP